MKATVSFTLSYTLEVPEGLSNDGLKEWVFDNAMPGVRYPDYSGNNSFVCIPYIKDVSWDWSDYYDDFEVKVSE